MVIAGLTPREAVRAVEARLSAAGCPDADYDARELFRVAAGRDARLSDRALTTEEAEKLGTEAYQKALAFVIFTGVMESIGNGTA